MDRELKGEVLAISAAACLALNSVIGRYMALEVSPLLPWCARNMLNGAFLLTVLTSPKRRHLLTIHRPDRPLMLASGITLACSGLFFYTSLGFLHSSVASMIEKLDMVFVLILSRVFYGRRTSSLFTVRGTLLIFVGSILVVFQRTGFSVTGFYLCLVSTAFVAAGSLLDKKLSHSCDSLAITCYKILLTLPVAITAVCITGQIAEWRLLLSHAPMVIAFSAVGLGFIFFFIHSLKFLDVSKAAPLRGMCPFITVLLAAFFLHEPVTAVKLTGSGLILAGFFAMRRHTSGP